MSDKRDRLILDQSDGTNLTRGLNNNAETTTGLPLRERHNVTTADAIATNPAEPKGGETLPFIPLLAKSVPPTLPASHKPRERVKKLLERGLDHPVTLVSAAEGFGKTTALADWYRQLAERGVRVAWFTSDRNDVDPRRFWMNFVAALGRAIPGIDHNAEAFADLDGKQRMETLWMLANSLGAAASADNPIVAIVERCDLLSASPTEHELFRFLAALSPHVHLYLSVRMRFSKYDLPETVTIEAPLSITSDDLAYTRDEIACAAQRALGRDLPDKSIDALSRATLGWPFGVTAALERAESSSDPESAIASVSGATGRFWGFFEHEVFSELTDEERRFMLATSALGAFCAHLCDYMLDTGTSQDVLESLSKRGMFVFPVDERGEWFSYHPLFSDWLRVKARSIPYEVQRQLNMRAARWFLRHNRPASAACHQILASEREGLLNLARAAFPGASIREIKSLFLDNRAPQPGDEPSLEFCLMAAWAYLLSADLTSTAYWADRARDLFEKKRPAVENAVELSLAVIEIKTACLSNDLKRCLELADETLPRLSGESLLPLRLMLLNCYAEACDQQGDVVRGSEYHRRMEAAAEGCPLEHMTSINLYEIAYNLFMNGNLGAATSACRAIESRFPSDFPARSAACALEAFATVMSGQIEGAAERLEQAASGLSPHRNFDMYLDWSIARAWLLFAQGDAQRCDLELLEAIERVKSRTVAIPRGAAAAPFLSRAIVNLCIGNIGRARAIYDEFAVSDIPGTAQSALGWELVSIMCDAERARKIPGGISADAKEEDAPNDEEIDSRFEGLSDIARRADAVGFGLLGIGARIALASLLFSAGKRSKAFLSLTDALEAAVRSHVAMPYIMSAPASRPVLAAYLAATKPRHEIRTFARSILEATRGAATAAGADVQERPELGGVSLTPRERDVLRLSATGLGRADIAEELCISETTVKTHLSHLYAKLGVTRFTQLISRAAELGLV